MGVSTNCYTVYGRKLPYDAKFSDAFHSMPTSEIEAMEKHVIIDGMSGEYMVVGAILFDSGDARWQALEGFAEIDVGDLERGRRETQAAFVEHMPDSAALLDGPWKLMTFVHYS